MPNSVVKSIADKSGKPEDEVEKLWNKAKAAAKEEYPDLSEDDDKFWSIVTGITKKMAGLNDSVISVMTDEMRSINENFIQSVVDVISTMDMKELEDYISAFEASLDVNSWKKEDIEIIRSAIEKRKTELEVK